ncbi:MAG: hypothetical protein HZA90_12655 [Verrucomicrobia bacterium]|nr:hypothetical protein [Verrucomicrobiota bacterium]
MKKLIVVLTLCAFALAPSLVAGEGCCDKAKAKDKAGEKVGCPAGGDKKGCCPKEGGAKECPAGKEKAPPKA